MVLLLVKEAILLAGTGLAAYTDAKTGLIPDKITYSMIAAGLIINLVEFNLTALAVPALVFAIGFVLYWLGKIGGGDVKLFTGIAMLLPYLNGRVFVMHVLLAAALLSMVFYSVYYLARYWRKGIDLNANKDGILKSGVLGTVIAAYFYFVYSVGMIEVTALLMFSVAALFALAFLAFEKGIKKNFFLKEVELKKLEEDEVVAIEFLDKEIAGKIGLGIKRIIGDKEIEKLKKIGISKVPVYRDMPPFGPFIFLGTVLILLSPELFSFLII